jgi:hypothetical protein
MREAAVEDADEAVAHCPEGLFVRVATSSASVIEGPRTG